MHDGAGPVSISSLSFYQQDQNWYTKQQDWDSQQSSESSLMSVMTGALQNQETGLASIANATALKRVDSQISAAVQSELSAVDPSAGASSDPSSSSSNDSSTSS